MHNESTRLDPAREAQLTQLARALVNQDAARIVVPPDAASSGFWFGGGNLTEGVDGNLYLVGRYRNRGDSRTGLGAGERGLELAVFRSRNRGANFEKVLRFTKRDLDVGHHQVLSIEGSALHWTEEGVELFVSTEKSGIGYPPEFASFLKPDTGVWTIDRLQARSIEQLREAPVETILSCCDPQFLHVKDPVAYDAVTGEFILLFCTHPYCWTSSNTAYTVRPRRQNSFTRPCFEFFPRGLTWDVAMTRGTAVMDVPQVGAFRGLRVSLLFYDGGECVRNLDQHEQAVRRPRGYSCEEIGGVAYFLDGRLERPHRLSTNLPLLISPRGTGCSRYVDVFRGEEGLLTTWQQSQADLSQPLVMNVLSHDEVETILRR